MRESDISQLQASAAQAVADLGTNKPEQQYSAPEPEKRYVDITTDNPTDSSTDSTRLPPIPDGIPTSMPI
jgi:hypothetical protein